MVPIWSLFWSHVDFHMYTLEWKFYSVDDCIWFSFIPLSAKSRKNSAWWLIRLSWLVYGCFRCFLNGIHVIIMWRLVGVILWQLEISIGVIYFMECMISMIFLLIFLRVFMGGIIFTLRVLLIHYWNIRRHVHSRNVSVPYPELSPFIPLSLVGRANLDQDLSCLNDKWPQTA